MVAADLENVGRAFGRHGRLRLVHKVLGEEDESALSVFFLSRSFVCSFMRIVELVFSFL